MEFEHFFFDMEPTSFVFTAYDEYSLLNTVFIALGHHKIEQCGPNLEKGVKCFFPRTRFVVVHYSMNLLF